MHIIDNLTLTFYCKGPHLWLQNDSSADNNIPTPSIQLFLLINIL